MNIIHIYHHRYLRCVIVLTALLGCLQLTAQSIVNIESKRLITDTVGWAGSGQFSFRLNQNVEREFALSSKIHIQYKHLKSLYLFLTDLTVIDAGQQRFVDAGFAHFRYNYKVNNWLRWEAFSQVQYNDVLKIKNRLLFGTGPRFKAINQPKWSVYVGSLYMYEIERLRSPDLESTGHRLSAYLSTSMKPWPIVDLSTTWYVQPLFEDIEDVRLAGQIDLEIDISKAFTFITSFSYLNDQRPAEGIPHIVYALSNGIKYKFGR